MLFEIIFLHLQSQIRISQSCPEHQLILLKTAIWILSSLTHLQASKLSNRQYGSEQHFITRCGQMSETASLCKLTTFLSICLASGSSRNVRVRAKAECSSGE